MPYIDKNELLNGIYSDNPTDVMLYIARFPTADVPERNVGKWIYDGTKRICPFCKDFIVTGRSIVKYCWNCGADMRKETEDE